MRRSTSRTTGDRVGVGIVRATVEKTNDDPRMREVDLKLMHGEKGTEFEHPEPYGFSSRVKDATTEDGKKRHAEAFVVKAAGNSSHPFAAVIADRRYRPKDLQQGEVTLHDDQKQRVHLKRDMLLVTSPKKVRLQAVDDNGTVMAWGELRPDGTVYFKAAKFVFEGEVHLGADGGKLVHRKDDLDSDGDAAVGSATKVYAV